MFYFRSNISIFGALSLLYTDVTCKRPVVFEHPVPNVTSSAVQNDGAREFRSGEGMEKGTGRGKPIKLNI